MGEGEYMKFGGGEEQLVLGFRLIFGTRCRRLSYYPTVLGVMAEAMGVEVEDVASHGAGLAFIVYPEAVTTMPISPAW